MIPPKAWERLEVASGSKELQVTDEAGLGQSEVRRWDAWHRPSNLSVGDGAKGSCRVCCSGGGSGNKACSLPYAHTSREQPVKVSERHLYARGIRPSDHNSRNPIWRSSGCRPRSRSLDW